MIVHTLIAVPALADEEQPELVIDGEYVGPIEELVEDENKDGICDVSQCLNEKLSDSKQGKYSDILTDRYM